LGGEILQKKKFYAIIGISVIVLSSFALVYAATWTPDDMAVYMQNIGRHKIYQTNWILYNEIGPKMGQGLGGEWAAGTVVVAGTTPITIWSYKAAPSNPKKVTFWIDVGSMSSGDSLNVWVNYDASPVDTTFNCSIEDTLSRKFNWTFDNEQTDRIKLIVDELSVIQELAIRTQYISGGAITVYYQYIIEEM
jgi:hypothetical protein